MYMYEYYVPLECVHHLLVEGSRKEVLFCNGNTESKYTFYWLTSLPCVLDVPYRHCTLPQASDDIKIFHSFISPLQNLL